MTPKIRPWQRCFHKFIAWRPLTMLLARILHDADLWLLFLSGGRLTFAQFSGLPIVELTTTGAKSGKQRTVPLAGYPDGEKIILIASNFGQAHHPAWFHNLKANPECTVTKNGQSSVYIAREADKQENDYYFNMAVSYYIGYEAYKKRAEKRRIPVMILEPKE